MPDHNKQRCASLSRRLIALISATVPRRFRARFRQEWEAELEYREGLLARWGKLDWSAKLELLWRSAGAFRDALWLQPRRLEDEMIQDLRFGVRMLLKSPAFTLAAILSLAIGIGANTALFSVVNAVLWRPLPYPDAERLVRVGEWSVAELFATLKQSERAFDGMAGWNARDYMLTGRGGPAHLKGQRVTPELLTFLGVTPQAGRAFLAEEFQPGRNQVALISHRLWQSRFGSDPQLIGQAVTLDQQSYTVVGVTPPGFDFFPTADLLTPLALTASDIRNPDYHLNIVARLKPGLTLEQARQEMARIAPVLEEQRNAVIKRVERQAGSGPAPGARPFDARRELRLQPLRELLVKDFRLSLLVLWGVVGFVLLIACANIANLMLARAANRQKEFAIRAAVGARRMRLARQLLTESALVACIGGALGLLCAYLGVQALVKLNPAILPQLSKTAAATIPRLGEVAIDGRVMAFNFGLTFLTGLLFGLAPALQFSRPNVHYALKEGALVSAKGFRFGLRRGAQSLLVVGEVAMALVLLVGAGLLIRSVWRLQQIEPGFNPDKLLSMQLEFPASRYYDNAQVMSFITELNERLAALPGVESVGAADSLPLTPVGRTSTIFIEGKADLRAEPDDPNGKGASGPSAFLSRVSPGYFRTLGIPLRQGREFGPEDRQGSLLVAIINEAMAHRYWPGENPLGKRVGDGGVWRTVVGVAPNVKRFALEDQPKPELYMPSLQPPGSHASATEQMKLAADYGGKGKSISISITIMPPTATQGRVSYISLMARTRVRPEAMVDAVRKTVWSLDPDQPILQLGTMQARLDEFYAPRRFNMLLFGAFALVALLLAAIGIYGVLAYLVEQRTHEIGIRVALGAKTRDVLWLIVRQGLALTLIGVVLGLGAALALTRVLQNLLYGVSATDPATFAGIALLLLGVACVASFIPARRATKVDPLAALRHE
jgi:predicted permease